MENEIMIGIFGLIIIYLLYKFVNKKRKRSTFEYSDILTNDKYKVKSQWDK